jgi:hypothetical protein
MECKRHLAQGHLGAEKAGEKTQEKEMTLGPSTSLLVQEGRSLSMGSV